MRPTTKSITRRRRADIDGPSAIAELKGHAPPSEAGIAAMAAEDGDAWTGEDFAKAQRLLPPPGPEEIKAIRTRLGLSQPEFARRFGFGLAAVRQYEYGRRSPKGTATTLLRLVQADPEGVSRALRWPQGPRRA